MGEMLKKILTVLSNEEVLVDEPMSRHTTFRIGGKADFVLLPKSTEEICRLIEILKSNSIPYFIMGNGSNLLVSDKGYRGAIIKISGNMNATTLDDDIIIAKAGILLSKLANFAYQNDLTGLEFASGIPGTLGGAIFMNAGAYGPEMKDIITEVQYLNSDGKVSSVKNEGCQFGYRKSIFMNSESIILGCKIKLSHGDKHKIMTEMDRLKNARISKQPVDKMSAGSTFKRPPGNFAGTLIDKTGLRGYSIGAAQVSEKHAGFIINNGNATANDVLDLIYYVKNKVYEVHGVMLEPEVRLLGDF